MKTQARISGSIAVTAAAATLLALAFGIRAVMGMLGVIMLVHQIGSFLGVWLGGVVFDASGSYDWIWRLDIALAVTAALVRLPIRECPSVRARLPGALLVAGRAQGLIRSSD
jgi:predicted MFS family arabinose efflux permease